MHKRRTVYSCAIAAAAALAAGDLVHATSGTWTQTAAGTYNWNDNVNWTATPFPNANNQFANLGVDIAGDQTINLNQGIQLSTLTLGDSGALTSNFTLGPGSSGGSLTIGTGGLRSQNGNNVINAPLWLGAASGVTIQHATAGGSLVINGGISHATNGSFTLGGNGGRVVVNSGITLGTGALTIGTGVVTLNSANSYSGNTVFQSADSYLNLGHSGALGTGMFVLGSSTVANQWVDNTSGAPLTMTHGSTSFASFGFIGSNDLNLGAGPVRFLSTAAQNVVIGGIGRTLGFGGSVTPSNSNPSTVTFHGAGNTVSFGGWQLTIPTDSSPRSQVLAGNADIVISGAVTNGNGANNNGLAYRGYGTLTLQGSNTFTGTLRAEGGTTVLDYANAPSGTSSNYGLAGSTNNTVIVGGGTLEFRAKAGPGNITTQQIGGLQTAAGGWMSTIVVNRNGSDGMTVTAGALSRGQNSMYFFDLSSGGVLTTTTTNHADGMIGPSAFGLYLVKDPTGRVDFAKNSTNAAGGQIVALNATTDLPTATGSASVNYRLNGGLTLTNNVIGNSLRIDTTGTGQVLNLGTRNLSVDSIGVLFVGAHDYEITGTTGRLADTAATPQLFLEHFGTGKLTITARLSSSGGALRLVGPNTLTDWNAPSNQTPIAVDDTTGVQIYSQTVRFSYTGAGGFRMDASGGLTVGSSNLNLSTGAIAELAAADMTRNLGTVYNQVQWTGSGGFSAYGTNRFVNLNGGNEIAWGATNFVQTGARLILGSDYSTHTIDFRNPLDLGANLRTIETRDGANNGANGAVIDGRLSGLLSGAGGIDKAGTGTLAIDANNTYSGGTVVRQGRLVATGSGALGTGNVHVGSGAVLELDVNAAIGDLASLKLDSGATLKLDGAWASRADNEVVYFAMLGTTPINGVTYFDQDNNWGGYGNVSGFFAGSTGGLTVVPEPAGLSLLGLGGLILRRRRRLGKLGNA